VGEAKSCDALAVGKSCDCDQRVVPCRVVKCQCVCVAITIVFICVSVVKVKHHVSAVTDNAMPETFVSTLLLYILAARLIEPCKHFAYNLPFFHI